MRTVIDVLCNLSPINFVTYVAFEKNFPINIHTAQTLTLPLLNVYLDVVPQLGLL